jgi:hypothetical protein
MLCRSVFVWADLSTCHQPLLCYAVLCCVFISPQVVEGNPCYEYAAYVVFPWFGQFEVARAEKNGGNVVYTDLEAFKADYTSGALHPGVCYGTLVDLCACLWGGGVGVTHVCHRH